MTDGGGKFDERFIVFAPTGRDGSLTCDLLRRADIDCLACGSMAEVCERVEDEGAAALLIAEEGLVRSAFERLSLMLSRQEAWSDIPLLVFTGNVSAGYTRPTTSQLLMKLGNVTLLDRPVRPITMLMSARAALRARRRQYLSREEISQRQRAVQQRDQFLAMLGHELRNPLGAILMALDLGERKGLSAQYRAIVNRQARHLARLVDDLLEVSRVTSGKIVLRREPVNVAELVRRYLQSVQAELEKQRLNLTYHADNQSIVVDGDSVRLEQIVANLVTNAIKYTAPGGHIEVSVESTNNECVLRVRDDGVGVSKEMLPGIFELFVQASNTLDRAKGGMGIGLTLVKTLTELHDGRIDAYSDGVGEGSEFTIRLPLLKTAGFERVAEERVDAQAVHTRHVLVIEDNPDSRETLREMLQSCGHEVDAVGDGRIGITRALERKPDVLVIDIGLPGIDGYGVARKIREELGEDVYLIALTGYGQPEDRAMAEKAGFDIHLTKPVDFRQMQKLLGSRIKYPQRELRGAQ